MDEGLAIRILMPFALITWSALATLLVVAPLVWRKEAACEGHDWRPSQRECWKCGRTEFLEAILPDSQPSRKS